ncbi:hypothetical protein BCR37DRAFT_78293 [Protomyces lactucae-debilis]|uniref:Required for respiratory growth protein 9, mitochondrial n=1 Tax=Protomyces lactucae-debilis TaxID=2754530 RepID=A0A1Y2F9A3_PROLT|nr:uncharacterized protein BCR37DRAFT_78293 [Protomyces lactucae-debilis]ORY79916.1 hypothetical protein BCR37DRAFT_78293 [Protomyces lactucae-debilis]
MWLCRGCLNASSQATRQTSSTMKLSIKQSLRRYSERSIAAQEADELLKNIPGPIYRPPPARPQKTKLPFPSPRVLSGNRDNGSSLDSALRRPSRPEKWSPPIKKKPDWLIQKEALNKKFTRLDEVSGSAIKEPWQPRKKLSPEAMQGIRALRAENPDYDVPKLASIFKVSPEAVRRILRSKWQPTPEEAAAQAERWKRRKESVWKRWAEQGRAERGGDAVRGVHGRRTVAGVVEKRLSVKSGFV